jgi:hypothetical protein
MGFRIPDLARYFDAILSRASIFLSPIGAHCQQSRPHGWPFDIAYGIEAHFLAVLSNKTSSKNQNFEGKRNGTQSLRHGLFQSPAWFPEPIFNRLKSFPWDRKWHNSSSDFFDVMFEFLKRDFSRHATLLQ